MIASNKKVNAANKKVIAANKKVNAANKKVNAANKNNRSCVRIMLEGLGRVLLVFRAQEYFLPFFKHPFSLKN